MVSTSTGGVPMTLAPGVKDGLLEAQTELELRNLNDAAVSILADRFGFEYEPTGLAPRARKESDYVCWSMPLALRDRISDRLRTENRGRRRRGEPRLSRAEFLNEVFRNYLDARRSVAA